MELVLILAALAACVVAGLVVAILAARSRRPDLRMGSEIEDHEEDYLLASVGPKDSPIDRSAEVLDIEAIDRALSEPVRAPPGAPDRSPR